MTFNSIQNWYDYTRAIRQSFGEPLIQIDRDTTFDAHMNIIERDAESRVDHNPMLEYWITSEGSRPRGKHIVHYAYLDGSIRSFDGEEWTTRWPVPEFIKQEDGTINVTWKK